MVSTTSSLKKLYRVAIIGSAGRSAWERRLMVQVFPQMIQSVEDTIKNKFDLEPSQVVLVSGGAAWADDIAVVLKDTKQYYGLECFLPAKFNPKTVAFDPASHKDASTANYYHHLYSRTMGHDYKWSLTRLNRVHQEKKNVVLNTNSLGFFNRNKAIAESCKYMIALTCSDDEDEPPPGGGTRDTWNQALPPCVRIHIRIPSLVGLPRSLSCSSLSPLSSPSLPSLSSSSLSSLSSSSLSSLSLSSSLSSLSSLSLSSSLSDSSSSSSSSSLSLSSSLLDSSSSLLSSSLSDSSSLSSSSLSSSSSDSSLASLVSPTPIRKRKQELITNFMKRVCKKE